MLDDGDTLLRLVGAGLVLAVLAGFVVVGLTIAGPNDDDGTPDTEWTIERVNATHARVTHAGGEPVRTENIRVTVDSVRRATNWSDPVTEDDTTLVSASDGSLVRVVWNGGRGDRTIMASKRV